MTVITDAEISSVSLASSVVFPAGGTGNPISVAVIADEKSQSSQGGGSSTSFTKRELSKKKTPHDPLVAPHDKYGNIDSEQKWAIEKQEKR